jgi:hypothetical protein
MYTSNHPRVPNNLPPQIVTTALSLKTPNIFFIMLSV